MYRLVFDNRSGQRPPFTTSVPLIVIGRDAQCQLRLLDHGVGDRHAAIERTADGYQIRDLGSANPTRVNNEPVTQQRLAPGDEIEIAAVRFTFEIVHEPPPRVAHPDWLQLAAVFIITALLASQAVLFLVIFSQHRHRGMRLDNGHEAHVPELLPAPVGSTPLPAPAPVTTAAAPPSPAPVGGAAQPELTAVPTVLNKLLRIGHIERRETLADVTLDITVRAGVGERTLNGTETALTVQFFRQPAPREGKNPVPLPLQTLPGPADWENFTAKRFSVRCATPPRELAGYVVQTYYRNQLQDVLAEPPSLAAAAVRPLLR